MIKWIIGLVVVVIIGAGLWWSGMVAQFLPKAQTTPPATTSQETTETPAPVSDLPTPTNDASDTAIAQDSAAVDAQLASLGTDATNLSNSLNDKPVTQEF